MNHLSLNNIKMDPELLNPDYQVQLKIIGSSWSKTFKSTSGVYLYIFSYLPGWTLFHKIAVLNKTLRDSLPRAGILD